MAEPPKTPPTPSTGLRLQSPPQVPFLYFNGFEISTSLSDMGLLLFLDGQVIGKANMSFTMAKTLAANLTNAVEEFQKQTDHKHHDDG